MSGPVNDIRPIAQIAFGPLASLAFVLEPPGPTPYLPITCLGSHADVGLDVF
jgi:hypothetical protein